MMIFFLIYSFLIFFKKKALKCYQCDSSKDEYCPETWDRSDIEPQECEHVDYAAFCVKTTGIYGAIVGTRRFCSSRHMDNSCNEVNFPQDPRIYYSCLYTCNTDGCNRTHRLFDRRSILKLLFASAVATFAYVFFLL